MGTHRKPAGHPRHVGGDGPLGSVAVGSEEPADEFVDQDTEYRAEHHARYLEEDLASQNELPQEPRHCFSRAQTRSRLRHIPREGRAFISMCCRLKSQCDSAHLPERRAAASTLRDGVLGVPAVVRNLPRRSLRRCRKETKHCATASSAAFSEVQSRDKEHRASGIPPLGQGCRAG